MDVVMKPDAVGLYRLILAEGPRFPDPVNTHYRLGQRRVTACVAEALRTMIIGWRPIWKVA
jgi:hypothetical protein